MVARPWIYRGNITRIFCPGFVLIPSYCLNLETWSDGNWRKHGHCRRHRPPQTTILENGISRFQTWEFPFHQPLLRIQALLGVPLPIPQKNSRAVLPLLWIYLDSYRWDPHRDSGRNLPISRCRKSWFVAPPQGAVCSTAWSRKGSRSPEYFNLSWGLPGGSSPFQLQHRYYHHGWFLASDRIMAPVNIMTKLMVVVCLCGSHDWKWFQIWPWAMVVNTVKAW